MRPEAKRKAADLMKQNGISEQAVQHAIDVIFQGRPKPHASSAPEPTAAHPAERGNIIEAAIRVLEEEDNRPMRTREIWKLIEARALYTSLGRTPFASKLPTNPPSSA